MWGYIHVQEIWVALFLLNTFRAPLINSKRRVYDYDCLVYVDLTDR